jgi:hypothetical protein
MSTTSKKDRKDDETTIPSPSQIQREQQQAVNKALDETKDDIRKATNEARKEIPQYSERIGDIQEQTIQTVREIANNYIESQKEIINIFQSTWTPFVQDVYGRIWNNWWGISPSRLAETYGTMASSVADNVISASRLTNNTISTNAELFNTSLQQTRDSAKEFSKIGVNAVKAFNEVSNDLANISLSTVETVISRQQRK